MIKISADQIKLNQRELKARLGGAPSEIIAEHLAKCQEKLFAALNCGYHYAETIVTLYDDGCDLGFGKIQSRNLRKNLAGCDQAYVFGATLGFGVDRLLRTASLTSTLDHFIIDALASTAIEALCDLAQANLPLPTKARFSAGYGDFDITNQKRLLQFINAGKELGITLSDSCLMNPTKSVTAIMGIKNEQKDNRTT